MARIPRSPMVLPTRCLYPMNPARCLAYHHRRRYSCCFELDLPAVAACPGSRLQQDSCIGEPRHALTQGFPGGANEASGRQQIAGIHPGHPDYEQAVRLYAQQQAQAHATAGGASFPAAQVGTLCCNICGMLLAPATPPYLIRPVVQLGSRSVSQSHERFRWEVLVLTLELAHGA